MASALGAALDAESGVAGVAAALPPQYVDFKEQIRLEMLTIKQKMAELRALHSKASLCKFDDTGDEEVQASSSSAQ
jgi:syntaxin 16